MARAKPKQPAETATPSEETSAQPIDLRARVGGRPIEPHEQRFHIFLVDTGWNAPVSKAVRNQLPLIHEYQSQDALYILTHQQSVAALKTAPYLIGKDPTLLVYDLYARDDSAAGRFRGFRLNLGVMRNPEQALARLQEFVRFVQEHRAAVCLEHEVRRQMHREGLDGMIKILGEGLETGVEFV